MLVALTSSAPWLSRETTLSVVPPNPVLGTSRVPAPVFVKLPETVREPPNPDSMVPELLTLANVMLAMPDPPLPMERVGVEPDPPTVSAPAVIVSLPIVTV